MTSFDQIYGGNEGSGSAFDQMYSSSSGGSTTGVVAPVGGLPAVPIPGQTPNTLQWMLSPFTVWGTWATQLFGSYENNIRAARGLFNPDFEGYEARSPEFSTYEQAAMGEYPNPEDIGLSISYRGRMGGLYWIEELIRGPETDENQFLLSGRLFIPDDEFVQQYWRGVEILRQSTPELFATPQALAAETIMGGAMTLCSEQMVAETMNDPLIIFEAFGAGLKIVNGVNRLVGGVRRAVPTLDRGLTAIRTLSDTVGTSAYREVYRATRNIMGEAAYQRGTMQIELGASQRGIQQAGGEAWARGTTFEGEVMPDITRLLETPRDITSDIRVTRNLFGDAEAVDDIMEMVSRQMPDAPPVAQREIAQFLNRAWRQGDQLPEIENLFGVPTQPLLSNIEYARHVYAPEARQAAYSSLPTWRQRLSYNFENQLGRDITSTLQRRTFRGTITEGNTMSGAGRVGFIDGSLRILKEGEAAPARFVPTDKLFIDNPWEILFSRYGQHTRAVAASRMLVDTSNNPAFVRAADDINFPTIADVVGKAEFSRTFGRLGDDLVDIATNTRWRDRETAQGVLEWARTARDITDRPNAILNAVDTAIAVWRGQTLTPFLGYHMRNVAGGLMNVMMSGKCDVFDIIDATFPITGTSKIKGSTSWAWNEFRRMGLDRTGEVRTAWASTQKRLYDDPLLGTPIQSAWDVAREYNPFGRGGQTVGAAIENHQRFAMFLGAVRRGLPVEDATELTYRYLFDYQDVPRWFKQGTWARRVSAFPTWTMKNIPLQLEHMIERPNIFSMRGRIYNSLSRASGRANEPMPSYLEEQQGFPVPGGGFLALENFDPVASLGEVADIVRPLLAGEPEKAGKAALDFISNLLNPFVTIIPEQSTYTAPVGSPGEPGGMTPALPYIPEAQSTGWDFFRERPIYRDYSKWNEAWAAFGVEGKMPWWAQRGDHVLRSFARAYNETSSVLAELMRMSRGESDYSISELGARRALGIPNFQADVDKTIYFRARDTEREIAAIHTQISDSTATNEQLVELKDIYMEELGTLAHGTFVQLDPWSGEPRPWLSIAEEGEYTIKGRQQYFREFADTCHLLLYGRRGVGNSDIHQPIPLDDSERELIEGLLDACVQGYLQIMYTYAANNAEVNVQQEWDWIHRRSEGAEVAE